MAMLMSGEQQLAAPRETVWAKLNDPEVLKACIPGCETLEVIGQNEFQAVATNKIELTAALKSINSISAVLERMVKDVESGRGLAGALMRDDTLRVDVREMVAYFHDFSSNLYYGGIFGSKAKPPKREKQTGAPAPHSGRTPFSK